MTVGINQAQQIAELERTGALSDDKPTHYILIGGRACQEWHTVVETRHAGDMTMAEFEKHCEEKHIDFIALQEEHLSAETMETVKTILYNLENEGRGNSTDFSLYQYVEAEHGYV